MHLATRITRRPEHSLFPRQEEEQMRVPNVLGYFPAAARATALATRCAHGLFHFNHKFTGDNPRDETEDED
jgi:hypothetical protein